MADTIAIIGLQDQAAWQAAVAVQGLPSHSWHYAKGLSELWRNDPATSVDLAIVKASGSTMILPFRVRTWQGNVDITTLPGLSGALIRPDCTAPLTLWREYATSRNWVSGYIQLAVANDRLAVDPPDVIASHNALYVFDCSAWSLQSSITHNMRKMLARSDRIGARLVTDRSRLAEAFPSLYAQSMARAGASLDFSLAVLDCWFKDPGLRLLGAEVGGEIVAVLLCRVMGPWAEAHLPGATGAGRNLHNWLVWQSVEWFASQGILHYNIGGYGRAGDGMEETKRRLGATRHDLRSVRQIYQKDRYIDMCRLAKADASTLYFPAYRAPPG